VLASAGRTIAITTGGIGGPSQHDLGRAARLELGRFSLDSVLTIYRRPGPGAISAAGTLGNIGAQILSRFTVTFDFPHQRVILEPNARLAERFEYDMVGMGLRARGAAFDTVEVAWLVPNGPAAEAGLQTGDVIDTVDGMPVGSLGLEALRERLRHPGPVMLGAPGAAGRREVRLVARPLI
jgi:membrane-associated protease RseP (regulator of RpoE activity)